MASLLRSCKFIRFFAGFTRNLTFGGNRQDAFESSSLNGNLNVYSGLAIRALATQSATVHHDSSLERSLRRLDQDARRAGRISRKELDEVIEEIKQTRSATSSQSLMVIRCCGSLVPEEMPEVRTRLVKEIWNTLEALGVPMDVSHYNALLRVYLDNEHPFSPTEFLAELERKGVEPNRVTYQRLVARHCLQGDMEGAARILQVMREQQMPVNETVFNALVMGHARSGDMESARGILGVMGQAGLEPGAETYTALLSGYAQAGDMEAVRAVMAECETKSVELLDRDFLTIIYSLATSGHHEHIKEVMGHLKRTVGYNQDCINMVLRLVNANQERIALQLLETLMPKTRGEDQLPTGAFYVRQLVKTDKPVDMVVSLCDELKEKNLHPRGLLIALESALNLGKQKAALDFITALHKNGVQLRQHYFWPILASHMNSSNPGGICDVLRHMQVVGVVPIGETLRDYAVPGLPGNAENKVSQLRSAGISIGSAAASVVICLLQKGKLAEAAATVKQYKAMYPFPLMRVSLTQAFNKSQDVGSLLTVLQAVVISPKQATESEDDTQSSSSEEEQPARQNNSSHRVGLVVMDCIKNLRSNRAQTLQAMLEGLLEMGLGLSARAAEQLQELLGSELTTEVSQLLSKLAAGDLVPQEPAYASKEITRPVEGRDLEALLKTQQAMGQPTRNTKRLLLQHYCRIRNLEKAEETYKSLESEGFVFQSGTLALMVDMYAHQERLTDALATLEKLRLRDPEFVLDFSKTIRLASLLVQSDRFQEAIDLVGCMKSREKSGEESTVFGLRAQAWRLLNTLAEQGRIEDTQSMFEAISASNELPINNVILGPLIKAHIIKEDLPGALAKFEMCCEKYHATPWKNELACRFIQSEDATSLQKLTDLSTQVHGEVNSLYDLVLAFVECGRVRQARRILETPGLRTRPFRLNAACQRYSEEGQVTTLEGLKEATKDLGHIDRENIYMNLLNVYCKAGDADKAIGLWTQAQEEDLSLSDQFLFTLGNFLKEQGRSVPFTMPEATTPASALAETVQDSTQAVPVQKKLRAVPRARVQQAGVVKTTKAEVASEELLFLRQALRRQDVDKALEMKQILDSQNRPLSVRDSSQLIENLVTANRIGDASKITLQMLTRNTHPMPRVFRFLLNRMASLGDVDGIANIGSHLDDEKKKIVSYDNRLCNAHLISGRGTEYLQNLDKNLDAAKTPETFAAVSASFPRGGALGLLEKHPELLPSFTALALKFAIRGDSGPVNVLWMHKFVNGERDAAQELWQKYLVDRPRLMFQWVCQVARRTAAPQLASDLLALLAKNPSTTAGARGNVLSCLLDILANQQRYDEALKALTESQPSVGLEYINRTALQRLKTGLEEQGKTFPYTIPAKSASKAVVEDEEDQLQ